MKVVLKREENKVKRGKRKGRERKGEYNQRKRERERTTLQSA